MVSPITYLQQTRDEMKKVVWPTRAEVLRLTLMVIFVSVLVGLYIGALDLIFTKATELVIGVR
jgi:preprotein translocase subunit SecE